MKYLNLKLLYSPVRLGYDCLCYLFFLFIISCSPKPLAYFSIDPTVEILPAKIQGELNIWISPNVKDSLTVSGDQIKAMYVTEFRKSVKSSLYNSFSKNFTSVHADMLSSNATYSLEILSIEPKWKIVDTIQRQRYAMNGGASYNNTPVYGAPGVNKYGGNSYLGGSNAIPTRTSTASTSSMVPYYSYVVKAVFKYQYVLKRGDEIISYGEYVVESGQETEDITNLQGIFIDGLAKMCVDLNERIYSVKKLYE